jgi:serine/threonine protein kinase
LKNEQIKIADFEFGDFIQIDLLSFVKSRSFISSEMYQNEDRYMPYGKWSVGIIAYYLTTKSLPFNTTNSKE